MIKHVLLLTLASVVLLNQDVLCRNLLSAIRPRVARQAYRVAAAPEDQPQPYSFNINTQDENGTVLFREESGDGTGRITGQYGYQDPRSGMYRLVAYQSDPENGFSARVETNEPGTKTSNPANVEIISSAP